jgi:hypothetical protein
MPPELPPHFAIADERLESVVNAYDENTIVLQWDEAHLRT